METKTCWHQWLYNVGINDNLTTISSFVIDENDINIIQSTLPLESQLLSPFGINGKGNIIWQYCSPYQQLLFLCKLFMLFALMEIRTSFGNISPPVIRHYWYFDELVFYHKDIVGTNYYTILKRVWSLISNLIIRYIAPFTHSLYTSYH